MPGIRYQVSGVRCLRRTYRSFLAANNIEIGALEFIIDAEGRTYTYDVNTNTNYNPGAEAEANRYGMQGVAQFLGNELEKLHVQSDLHTPRFVGVTG